MLLPYEEKKNPPTDSMDAFALFSLYMVKALKVVFTSACREAMNSISTEQTQIELESTQLSLKEREEELNSGKDALAIEKQKCLKLCEEKQAVELEYDAVPLRQSLPSLRVTRLPWIKMWKIHVPPLRLWMLGLFRQGEVRTPAETAEAGGVKVETTGTKAVNEDDVTT
ncbi:hypothetical protein LIER_22497 [Lithospermum erythrorhizon]|uniref:Uncharacterized protein n=1 Tax=Lithospermum erythrorhizon TaxID=34254 RepID=A0AAV3QX64_LITER